MKVFVWNQWDHSITLRQIVNEYNMRTLMINMNECECLTILTATSVSTVDSICLSITGSKNRINNLNQFSQGIKAVIYLLVKTAFVVLSFFTQVVCFATFHRRLGIRKKIYKNILNFYFNEPVLLKLLSIVKS